MPGWIRKEEEPLQAWHQGEASAQPAPANPATGAAAAIPIPQQDQSGPRRALMQSQRDELIAEVLGDVAVLSDKLSLIQGQIQALGNAITANDFVRWRNTIDLKMSELADVNLSQQAAQRLEAFAQAYMNQLAKETNTLVVIQAKKAVADTMAFNHLFDKLNREWVLRLSSIGGVAFFATLLAQFVVRIF